MKKQKHRELEQIPPRLSVRRQQSQGQTRAGRSRGWCSNHCATLPVCAPSGFPGAVFTGWFVRVGWTVPQQEPSNLSSLKQQKFISCLCYMITEGQLTCQSSRQTGWPVWNTSSCHGRGERAPQLCLSSQKAFSRKWTWSLLLTFYWPKQGHFQGTWGVQFSHRERGTGGLPSLQGRHPWAAAGPRRTEPGRVRTANPWMALMASGTLGGPPIRQLGQKGVRSSPQGLCVAVPSARPVFPTSPHPYTRPGPVHPLSQQAG